MSTLFSFFLFMLNAKGFRQPCPNFLHMNIFTQGEAGQKRPVLCKVFPKPAHVWGVVAGICGWCNATRHDSEEFQYSS